MDQTKNNMDRTRAFDAEEGEWRTINGAHVLIKNGRIASGAGGALNGQPFRGGSLKKMQSGSKGMESGAYVRKLKSQAKEVAERNRSAMARRNAQYDLQHKARMKKMGYLLAEASKFPENSPLQKRYRNAVNAIEKEDQWEASIRTLRNHSLNQESYDLEGKAARYKSKRGEVASRAQRALERYRKSREAEKGGAPAPQQSAPHATKLGRMQPGSTAVNAGKEAKRLNHNANVYKRTARLQYAKKSAKLRPQYNEAKMEKEKAHTDWSKANSYLEDRRIRELQRTPENKQHEKHNAYRKLQAKNDARRNIAETAAENQATKIENELNDYHNRLTSNVVNRNIAASNAKSRLARMQQLAKALRKSRPDLFKRR